MKTITAPPAKPATVKSAAALNRARDLLGVHPLLIQRGWWWAMAAVVVVAGVMRFWNLDHPGRLYFDETYYVKDAYSLLHYGYETQWPDDANEDFARGVFRTSDTAAYVVHPPLGKWLIAASMAVFGPDHGLGWRGASALAGTIMVALIAIIATRMFRHGLFGVMAATLMAVDGHHLVLSRTGLLDIFLACFVLAAFLLLLLDRDWHRRRLLSAAEAGRWLGWRQILWRPYWLAAALLLGCAMAVKLSAAAFVLFFALMVAFWDYRARRHLYLSGACHARPGKVTLSRDLLPAWCSGAVLVICSYLLSWSGWISSSGGKYRHWAAENPAEGPAVLVPDWLRSLVHYHREAASFHAGLSSEHAYASTPWTWWFMGRPTSMFYEGSKAGEHGCSVNSCSAAITDLANPLLWWLGVAAFFVVLYFALARKDWRAWAVLTGYAAGFFFWLAFPNRTMFFFYTISYEPFVVLAVIFGLVALMHWLSPQGLAAPQYSKTAVVFALTIVALVVAVSLFFYPVWTAEQIPYEWWRARMWLPSWI